LRPISTEGFQKLKSMPPGAAPMLQWLKIADLVVDPAYQRPIIGKGRQNVDRIARTFSWSCFAPVVVSPVEGGKFAIIDGQHCTTSAALVGFESVPCQIVIAAREQQAAAFKAINGTTTPISKMALHAAALVASEPWAVQIAHVCACAEVELLRYPVPTDKQSPGQTMAVGAITRCLKQYGEATLITALQCVTQTSNNQPGALSARTIKALCAVLHADPKRRDSGLALFEAFDSIDLMSIQDASAVDSAVKNIGRVQVMADRIQAELSRLLPQKTGAQRTAGSMACPDKRNIVEFPNGHPASGHVAGERDAGRKRPPTPSPVRRAKSFTILPARRPAPSAPSAPSALSSTTTAPGPGIHRRVRSYWSDDADDADGAGAIRSLGRWR
jgi:ParB-like nuclease domain